eukprot:GHVO01015937.1.p1 GENE.GHVO01015937.1~~GHVO01015937.1.p1  ORF type:complete len:297 (+),score=64.97 GHVO01015937.1:313-1203(+)
MDAAEKNEFDQYVPVPASSGAALLIESMMPNSIQATYGGEGVGGMMECVPAFHAYGRGGASMKDCTHLPVKHWHAVHKECNESILVAAMMKVDQGGGTCDWVDDCSYCKRIRKGTERSRSRGSSRDHDGHASARPSKGAKGKKSRGRSAHPPDVKKKPKKKKKKNEDNLFGWNDLDDTANRGHRHGSRRASTTVKKTKSECDWVDDGLKIKRTKRMQVVGVSDPRRLHCRGSDKHHSSVRVSKGGRRPRSAGIFGWADGGKGRHGREEDEGVGILAEFGAVMASLSTPFNRGTEFE